MCIISVSNKGVNTPNEKTIRTMFSANPHGAGYMLLRDGEQKIVLKKGFFDADKFIKSVNELNVQSNDLFVMHFRIQTSGLTNQAMCHPFVITSDPQKANATSIVTNLPCLAHNGVISDLNGIDKKYSDTSLFVMDYLSTKAIIDNVYEEKAIQELLEKFVDSSRLCLLHPEKGLLLLGNWKEDDDGNQYSNETYKPKTYGCYGYMGGSYWGSNYKYNAYGRGATSQKSRINNKPVTKKKKKSIAEKAEEKLENQARLWEDKKPSWNNKMTKSELKRTYQKVLSMNPPKKATKRTMLDDLNSYYSSCQDYLEELAYEKAICAAKSDNHTPDYGVQQTNNFFTDFDKTTFEKKERCSSCRSEGIMGKEIRSVRLLGTLYNLCDDCEADYKEGGLYD
tara:strand:+ start:1314 stop:2498 length:1185 start_codon:yes stop_codon:yes gene_type:complete